MAYKRVRINKTEKAIYKTLLYSDIFHFPLTKDELWQYLLSDNEISDQTFEKALQNLSTMIATKKGYYCLAGNTKSIEQRVRSQHELEKKMRIAKRAAYYLSYIPTILLIGISGGVAIGNVHKHDDIDFFIITKRNTLFMTRLWMQAVLELLQLRLKRESRDISNKICVNLLIDETTMRWTGKNRDLYMAHEIVRMKPLFERNETYGKFLKQNTWVQKFFPNALRQTPEVPGSKWHRDYISLKTISYLLTLAPFEMLVRKIQKIKIKRHQTVEIVTNNLLAFHLNDYRAKTLAILNTKFQQLGLLTNN